MDTIANLAIAAKLNRYPKGIQKKLSFHRQLILDTASEIEGMGPAEEALK